MMKNLTTVPVLLLSLAGLAVFGQVPAIENNDDKTNVTRLCQAEAQGAIDPEIIAQECIELKLQELASETEGQAKKESWNWYHSGRRSTFRYSQNY